MKSAYLYVRVSTDEQKRKGYSLIEQEDRLLKHCEINNITVRGIYREDFSAKDFNRPEWKKLIAVIRKNKQRPPENILFIKWDRFSRNIEFAYQMIGVLKELNMQAMAIDQPIDFEVPESIVMLAVYLSIPEAENSRRGRNTSDGLRRAKKLGRWPGKAALTDEIINANLNEDQRHLMLVYHAENIHSFALEAFLHFNSSFQLSQSLKIEVPLNVKIGMAQFSTEMFGQSFKLILDAYRFAEANNFYLLKASAAHNSGKFFFQARYYFLMQQIDENQINREDLILEYRRNYAFSVTAYNHFMKLQMQQNAHEAICTAYELQSLCSKLVRFQLGRKTGEELMTMIRSIEDTNDLQPFNSAADFASEVIEKSKSGAPTRMAQIKDEEIEQLAKDALNVYQLPVDRLPNMITEIKAVRSFESACKNPDMELLTNNNHLASNTTKYLYAPTFVFHHKHTRMQTPPDDDINRLLSDFKHLLS